MNNWWKDPRLDDEGTYDYLVEELPKDHCGWNLQRYTSRCDSCVKERHLLFRATSYFYCWDGWDSHTYTECWKCMVKDKIWGIKRRMNKKIKIVKDALYLAHNSSVCNFRYHYKFAKEMNR